MNVSVLASSARRVFRSKVVLLQLFRPILACVLMRILGHTVVHCSFVVSFRFVFMTCRLSEHPSKLIAVRVLVLNRYNELSFTVGTNVFIVIYLFRPIRSFQLVTNVYLCCRLNERTDFTKRNVQYNIKNKT